MGRYLSPEPMLQEPGWVLAEASGGYAVPTYAYARNNPLAYTIEDLEEKLRANPEGFEKRHHWLDLVVSVMVDHNIRLDDAEGYAREMVAGQPDRSHLRMLSRVCATSGKAEEAAQLKAQAQAAPEMHMIDEIRKIAEQEGLDLSFLDKWD